MPTIYEGRAKIEYAKENDTLYISGKKGLVLRIEGLNLPDGFEKAAMLDIKVEGCICATVGESSHVEPGEDNTP